MSKSCFFTEGRFYIQCLGKTLEMKFVYRMRMVNILSGFQGNLAKRREQMKFLRMPDLNEMQESGQTMTNGDGESENPVMPSISQSLLQDLGVDQDNPPEDRWVNSVRMGGRENDDCRTWGGGGDQEMSPPPPEDIWLRKWRWGGWQED